MPKGYVYFASCGKSTAATILPSPNHIWLKAKLRQWCFCLIRQNKKSWFTWSDQEWIGLMIFKNFVDQEWIGFNFIGSGLDWNWKISHLAHLWCSSLVDRMAMAFDVQCCHCCFFSLDLCYSVLSGIVGFLLKICFFFTLVKF